MPGDPLYGIKLQVEHIQVTLAGSEADQAEVRLHLARTRMDELQTLVERSGPVDKEVPRLLKAWKEEVGRSSGVLLDMAMKGDTEARSMLEAFTAEQSSKLAGVVEALSGDAAMREAAQTLLTFIEEVDTQLRSSAGSPTAPVPPPGEDGTLRPVGPAPSPSPTGGLANAPTAPPPTQGPSPSPTYPQGDSTTPSSPPSAPAAPPPPPDGSAPTVTPPPPSPTATTPPTSYSLFGPITGG
jgi:hypothetical protein